MLTPGLLFAMMLNSITSTIRNVMDIAYLWNKMGLKMPDLNLKERVSQVGAYFSKDKDKANTNTNDQQTPTQPMGKAEQHKM